MRIAPISETMRSLNRVQEKQDADGHSHQQHQQHQQKKSPEELQVEEVDDKKVADAIQAFDSDARNRANGLHADKIGHGPGLRVVLRDGTGAVVRQFTGEEFLRVREAAFGGRGKILDQKL